VDNKKFEKTREGSTRGKSNNNNNNNNNNQKSSSSNNNTNNNNNKVVIVAPPQQIPHQIALAAAAVAAKRTPSPVSQQQQQQQSAAQETSANVSPSVAIPALKKRTGVVKQSIPPPVPPRGSPRTKSKLVGVSSSYIHKTQLKSTPNIVVNVDEMNGRRKVEEWLSKIEPLAPQKPFYVPINIVNHSPIDEESIEFQSISKLIETFTSAQQTKSDKVDVGKLSSRKIISDTNFVRNRVDCYNTLDKIQRTNRILMSSESGGTDSGIDISSGIRSFRTKMTRFSNEEEFV
jgi:hypothetical protein